jgi:exodeoxyribonuclease III
MRIVTWNCARGPWTAKRDAIDTLRADIAVITEAPRAVAEFGLPWLGKTGSRNGTTVVAGPGYNIEPLPVAHGVPCVNPVRVTGRHRFTLLVVWTWMEPPHKNYKDPLLAGLTAYRHLDPPFVIAGDFNGNTRFDKPKSRLTWSTCFAAVESLGVVSAYHSFHRRPFGAEEEHPTQYQTRKAHRPFHLDYVFVPAEWSPLIRGVSIPPFSEFTLSDHRPVVVDLDM